MKYLDVAQSEVVLFIYFIHSAIHLGDARIGRHMNLDTVFMLSPTHNITGIAGKK